MGAFEGLGMRLNHIFSKLKNKGALTELEIKQAMREVRIALLEADVNFTVVKNFVASVTEKAVGEEVLKSLTPTQQVIKIVNEELTALLGGEHVKLAVSDRPPTIILMCGLQGSGKTTMCGKLGMMLKKSGKKPALVACDVYRPAAILQLQRVGEKAGVPVIEQGQIAPLKIVKHALSVAEKNAYDTLIVDTAGRLHVDEALMNELKELKAFLKPAEILLVVDSMTGQDAVNVAEKFNELLDITGVILTKLDGDTRGGAALSIKAVTGKSVRYCGTGEKMGDIEPFHPERMASRILGMGDVLTLIEKAQEAYTEEEARELERKMRAASFTLSDYLDQLDKMKKMGNLTSMIKMIPGLSAKLGNQDLSVDENKLARTKAIIQSMTVQERENPRILNASRKRRIAAGCGLEVVDVNRLLKSFETLQQLTKSLSRGRMPDLGG
ncbi:MAG: signal recognition particle protein, partial [Clostridia bacterium]|nr:signal recognition particle protein [Clostridia bacterium]